MLRRLRTRFYSWVASLLPRELVSACGWRLWAHAIDGRWACSLEESCRLPIEEVQLRWFERSEIP